MQRFFIASPEKKEEKIFVTEPQVLHHAKNVLRLKEKELVMIFDAQGNEYSCVVEEIGEKMVLKIKKSNFSKIESNRLKIAVACAIPKKAKMDEIIDKLTQLGVDEIIPMETQRVIVKLEAGKKAFRKARWEKIALSASQQSQRNSVPVVAEVTKIKDVFLRAKDFDLKLIPTLSGKRESLSALMQKKVFKNILVLIGPEGDFTDEEVAQAKARGFIPVSLGNLVLRVDTAAIAVASFLKLNENF
ncbi:MAG: RsmE family RNA methyltransferase [Candidatus Omnitrophica bacterium]|nr:RsmE family RNA methyltransferase [Candidatus Omnitrophota bacterium]MDD5653475.1 RsmE family RNA methyltransferase [Candidatus Omnitrophota bacterium]